MKLRLCKHLRTLIGYWWNWELRKNNIAYVEIFLTNPQEHSETVIDLFKEYLGQHRPAGSLIGVTYLAFPEQLIEVKAIAHTD
ncbi:hypothetical protein BsIDN1_22060 [Bacillus safensis]|uniref:Uncharacterized protein n=1 Tax=Bacillus safensis TaxID=561879 RepID=A0A5S9M6W8_BACIA|nr:hypothetical protein BsIDN1_22060 [Bacillus safensis]